MIYLVKKQNFQAKMHNSLAKLHDSYHECMLCQQNCMFFGETAPSYDIFNLKDKMTFFLCDRKYSLYYLFNLFDLWKYVENQQYIDYFFKHMLTLKKLSANQILFLGIIFPDSHTFFQLCLSQLFIIFLHHNISLISQQKKTKSV